MLFPGLVHNSFSFTQVGSGVWSKWSLLSKTILSSRKKHDVLLRPAKGRGMGPVTVEWKRLALVFAQNRKGPEGRSSSLACRKALLIGLFLEQKGTVLIPPPQRASSPSLANMIKCHLSLTPSLLSSWNRLRNQCFPNQAEQTVPSQACSNRLTKDPMWEFITIFQDLFLFEGAHQARLPSCLLSSTQWDGELPETVCTSHRAPTTRNRHDHRGRATVGKGSLTSPLSDLLLFLWKLTEVWRL